VSAVAVKRDQAARSGITRTCNVSPADTTRQVALCRAARHEEFVVTHVVVLLSQGDSSLDLDQHGFAQCQQVTESDFGDALPPASEPSDPGGMPSYGSAPQKMGSKNIKLGRTRRGGDRGSLFALVDDTDCA